MQVEEPVIEGVPTLSGTPEHSLDGRSIARRWETEVSDVEPGPLAMVEALLKSPASILREIRAGRALGRLSALLLATLTLVGLGAATFGGGFQFLLVPIKMAGGFFFSGLLCLPSLHIISCLSGARQRLRETWGALLMGIALTSLLLLGFAPIAWVFSQATSSVAFVGALHLAFLVSSCFVGLRLVKRTLDAMNGAPLGGLRLWSAMFVVVLFQMTTTLRPLVGPSEGLVLKERLFFLVHWLRMLGS